MADQLSGGMGNLSLDSAPPAAQHAGQQPRSYIPPHMRNKMGGAPNGPPPAMNGPQPGPGPMGGLNNSAWAG